MDDIAREHIRDLRRQADGHRSATEPRETRRDHDDPRAPGLRRHVGFALVEAGFYLLGTDRLAAVANHRD
jgi:hypothetical protein